MKNAPLVLILVLAVAACATTPASQGTNVDEANFRKFLLELEEAQSHLLKGDPTLWKQKASHSDDVTILGGFGGFGEKGWKAVGARYDWVAAQYLREGATVDREYLNISVARDLAFTVSVERQQPVDGDSSTPLRVLRATQIFRREDGVWKLVHRHADPVVEKRAP